jgi:hypothetical protein
MARTVKFEHAFGDDTLSFTGAVCVGGRAKFSDGIPAPVDKEWGAVIGASGTGLFASPLDEQSAVWSLSYLASFRGLVISFCKRHWVVAG